MMQALRARELDAPEPEALMSKAWCVYSKACLSRAATVVKYLGDYPTSNGSLDPDATLGVNSQAEVVVGINCC